MTIYADHLSAPTPQSLPIPGRNMVKNTDGGAYVFQLDNWKRLDRFLIIGTDRNTYYSSSKALTLGNAQSVIHCIKEDGLRAVNTIVSISDSGRGIKNDTCIFALVLATIHGDDATRREAYSAIPKVCRTGTHLFQFMETTKKLRKSSKGLRRGLSLYYEGKSPEKLAYDMLKYANRGGWTHKDVMRLIHWKAGGDSDIRQQIIKYAFNGVANADLPRIVYGHQALRTIGKDPALAAGVIEEFQVPWEMVPTELLTNKVVLQSLTKDMNITATIRNLARLTANKAITGRDEHTDIVIDRLTNQEVIKKGRVHPMTFLLAYMTYGKGHGVKGSLTWEPMSAILAALQDGFEKSLIVGEKLNKRCLVALDVSPSMDAETATGISAREACAAMTYWLVRQERHVDVVRFSGGSRFVGYGGELTTLKINANSSLREMIEASKDRDWGGTDCSLPVRHALATTSHEYDLILVGTDNETNAGHAGHASQYFQKYLKERNPHAKMVVAGMTATECSIADPTVPQMLDVAGFDAAMPKIISEFVLSK